MLLSVFLLIRSTFAFIEELQFCEQMCMNADEEMDYTHSHTHTHNYTLPTCTYTHSLTHTGTYTAGKLHFDANSYFCAIRLKLLMQESNHRFDVLSDCLQVQLLTLKYFLHLCKNI